MREIKFRAWDLFKNKGMSKPFGLGCIYAEFNDGTSYSVDFVTQELIQYTGLKDKNGKEIYEGDIIKHSVSGRCGIVSYFEGAFVYGISITDNALINYNVPKYIEVIGNIHENPELLEKEKE